MRDIEAFAPGGAPALKYAAARPSRLIDNRRVQNSLSKYLHIYRECNGGACLRQVLAVDLPPRRISSAQTNATRFNARVVRCPYRAPRKTRINLLRADSSGEIGNLSLVNAPARTGRFDNLFPRAFEIDRSFLASDANEPRVYPRSIAGNFGTRPGRLTY